MMKAALCCTATHRQQYPGLGSRKILKLKTDLKHEKDNTATRRQLYLGTLPEKMLKLKSDLKPWTKQWVAKVTSDPMFLGLKTGYQPPKLPMGR